MKLSKVVLTSLLGCALFMSGCSGKEEKKAEDLKLEDVTMYVNGKAVSLYGSYEDLLKDWEVDGDTPEKLAGLEDESIYLTSKGDSKSYLTLKVFNPEDKEIDMKKAKILRMRADAEDRKLTYGLPAGVAFNDTIESVMKAFGTPLEYSTYDQDATLVYASSTAYDRAEYFYFDFENGKLTEVSMEGCDKKSKTSDDISFDTKTVLGYEPFVMPSEKGNKTDELAKATIMIEDITITKDTPITALLEKGYTPSYMDSYDDTTTMMLKKDNKSYDVEVSGVATDVASLTKDNLILEVSAYDGLDNVTLVQGIKGSANAKDVLAAFGIPSDMQYDDDGVMIRYSGFDNQFAVHLSYSPEGDLEYLTVKFDYDLY